MDGSKVTKLYSERPLIFLLAMAIMAAFILGMICFVYFALTDHHRDHRMFQTGVTCTNWKYESQVEKHIDGPDIQQKCEQYFAARSTDDAERDDAVWQHKIDAADAKWQSRQQ